MYEVIRRLGGKCRDHTQPAHLPLYRAKTAESRATAPRPTSSWFPPPWATD
jgi:hypothetical protein